MGGGGAGNGGVTACDASGVVVGGDAGGGDAGGGGAMTATVLDLLKSQALSATRHSSSSATANGTRHENPRVMPITIENSDQRRCGIWHAAVARAVTTSAVNRWVAR